MQTGKEHMTISVTIKNTDSRQNAIVEILSTDEYQYHLPFDTQGNPVLTRRSTSSHGLLRGGEEKTVMLCSDRKLEIVERMNEV
jgi:hypothetical protein